MGFVIIIVGVLIIRGVFVACEIMEVVDVFRAAGSVGVFVFSTDDVGGTNSTAIVL